MKGYKTSEADRERMKRRRDLIRETGGEAYAALLERERAQRAKYRRDHPDYWRRHARKDYPFKTNLCASARARARKKGIEATITPADLDWPTHCPVLGIELDYPERSGRRKNLHAQPNWPSLDRHDPKKGYVPGNVFVMSFRANSLKSNATYDEIILVSKYLSTSGW